MIFRAQRSLLSAIVLLFPFRLLHSLSPASKSTSTSATNTNNNNNNAVRLPIFFDSSNHLHRSLTFHPEQPARIEECIKALLQEYQQPQQQSSSSSSSESETETLIVLDLVDVAAEENARPQDQSYNQSNNDDDNNNTITMQQQPFSQSELDHARDILLRIHSPELVTALERKCRDSRQRRINEGKDPLGFVGMIDEDTYVTTETYDVCLRATAAWIRAVDSAVQQQIPSSSRRRIPTAMALTRPPGHHATTNQSNGFCIFNFAAAAAVHYLESIQHHPNSKHNNVRISILDWDVHYGQGVADIVSRYPESIRYASIHQNPAFPYMGTKRGAKQFVNVMTIPMTADTTWTCGYQQYFQDALDFLFQLDTWEPDLVIVCAGYDALDSDELASVSLQARDFGRMTRALQDRIRLQQQQQQQQQSSNERSTATRLMLGMEGGYQLSPMAGGGNLQQAVLETVNALLE